MTFIIPYDNHHAISGSRCDILATRLERSGATAEAPEWLASLVWCCLSRQTAVRLALGRLAACQATGPVADQNGSSILTVPPHVP